MRLPSLNRVIDCTQPTPESKTFANAFTKNQRSFKSTESRNQTKKYFPTNEQNHYENALPSQQIQITRADLHQYLSNPNVQINTSQFIDANKGVIQRFLRKLSRQDQDTTTPQKPILTQAKTVRDTPARGDQIDIPKARAVLDRGKEFVKPSNQF
jgi:hypothetical protein